MVRLWLSLRRIRQHAAPRSDERREIEAYLRKQNVFEDIRPAASWVRVFSGVAAMVLVLCIGASSYAYASEAVLPNTVLYPVREAIERVEVALAVTPVQKQKVEKKLEVRRVKEVKKLTELKRPVPGPLKKYVGVTAATTTNVFLKNVPQEKTDEQKVERKKRQEETRKKAEERLQSRFRLRVLTSSQQIVSKRGREQSRAHVDVRERRRNERQTLLEQRRMQLEKRAQERQQRREAERDRKRVRTE